MSQSDPLFTFRKYISHRVSAKNAHGLHSPFLFDLYNTVIKKSRQFRHNRIEEERKRLYNDHSVIEIKNWSTGGTKTIRKSNTIRKSAASRQFSAFLMLLADKLEARTILETGSCAGLTTAYLAASKAENIISIEGDPTLADIARQTLKNCEIHADIIQADLTEQFNTILRSNKPDLIFLDASHRFSTIQEQLNHIKNSIIDSVKAIIIHDIYWSRDMFDCWAEIVKDPRYKLTVDLFEAGIIFPNREMEKQHFALKFR